MRLFFLDIVDQLNLGYLAFLPDMKSVMDMIQ